MPLEISSLKFDYISGPTSLAFIYPIGESVIPFLKDESLMCPPILLLGDVHKETTLNCGVIDECITNESNCTSTFSPLFFRCLDSLTNQDYPVDIYLEAGIFPRFLKDPYLFDESRFKSLFDTNDGVMTYIPRYHSTCFSTAGESQESCFTKNIRYHLSDIRYQPSFLKLLDNEVRFIDIANDLIKNDKSDLSLEEIYTRAEELNKDEKNSRILDRLDHFPTFESYLFYEMENVVYNIIMHRTNSMFFDNDVNDLFNTLIDSPYNFVDMLINIPEFKSKSFIYKRIKESIFKEDFCLQLFKEYISYYFKNNLMKKQDKVNCYNCVNVINRLDLAFKRRRITSYLYNKRIDSIKTSTMHISNELFVPIMDFYFLITNWKQQYKNSIMSVYIAGDEHVKNIRKFLMTKGYYRDDFSFINNNPIVTGNKYIYGKTPLIRCIEIPKKEYWSIEDTLSKFYINNKQISKARMILNKSKLQTKRIKYFGKDIVQDMLNGKAYSRDKLIDVYKKHVLDNIKKDTPANFIEDLELDFIIVPSEYKDKRLTI